jgi:hypothetical protein
VVLVRVEYCSTVNGQLVQNVLLLLSIVSVTIFF